MRVIKIFEVIKNPWEERFYEYISNSTESIKICSPFVKNEIILNIYKYKRKDIKLNILTNFNIASFHRKASDIEAIECTLLNNGKVRNVQNLHAKIYIFDSKSAIITSANLTHSGLYKNYEYGVLSKDKSFVDKVDEDFEELSSSEFTSEVTVEDVNNIKEILNVLPKNDNIIYYPDYNQNLKVYNDDEILVGEADKIKEALKGWKLSIFNIINNIQTQNFSLNDVYQYQDFLHDIYPNNNNIEAKIRQQIQFLRNLGLIKFLGNGQYKKLWI